MQTYFAQSSFGRILLHVACACRDHKYQWHWRGIRREILSLEKRIVNRKVMSLPTRVAIPLSEWRVTSFLAILSQRVLAVMPDAPKPDHVFLQKQTGQVW
jgi:hypothetical protein